MIFPITGSRYKKCILSETAHNYNLMVIYWNEYHANFWMAQIMHDLGYFKKNIHYMYMKSKYSFI